MEARNFRKSAIQVKLKLYYPVSPFLLNQGFGSPSPVYTGLGLLGHNGLDFNARDGQIIRAAHGGEVTFTGEDGSGGLGIVIRTLEKFEYNGGESYFKTIYWHIQRGGFLVKAGDIVKSLQPIARANNTGLSSGPHLHFGLKPQYQGENNWEWWNIEQENGYKGAIDPAPYFEHYKHHFTPLSYLQRGQEVKELQWALKLSGQFPYDQDTTGFYGEVTRKAVMQFQMDWALKHNLGVRAGEQTCRMLNLLYDY